MLGVGTFRETVQDNTSCSCYYTCPG